MKKTVHRGVIGIEMAIILLMFAIVASGLLFVVLNSGINTTQKTKSLIQAGLIESRSSLTIAGAVVGVASIVEDKLNATAIPVKISMRDGEAIDMSLDNIAVRVIQENVEHGDIYTHVISDGTHSNLENAMQQAVSDGVLLKNPITQTAASEDTQAILFFTLSENNNTLIDSGEQAFMVIVFNDSERPSSLDPITIEIVLSTGTPLTVERSIPDLTSSIMDIT